MESDGMSTICFDAGSKIDAGAMVVTKELYFDYKAPVPRFFDKIVVVQVETIKPHKFPYGRFVYGP